MKAVVTACACAALAGALALGCYEESFAPPAGEPAPVAANPPPPAGRTNVQPQTQAQTQTAPPERGVTNVQPPSPSARPAYDASRSAYALRAQQLLIAAEHRIQQLRSFEANAPESTRSNIETAVEDMKTRRDKLVADMSKMDTASVDGWKELAPMVDTDMSDLAKSIQSSSASMNALPQP
jgi:hypothetical protein